MALVMSPWFGRGCGRRARPFRFGSPSLFTDLVLVKVPGPQMRQSNSCAPAGVSPNAMSNARVVQWTETPEAHIFKLRLPGLKKEDLQIQVEDDRTLYISYNKVQSKEGTALKEGEAAAAATKDEQNDAAPKSEFMRKFKLPETADVEQIKAEVTNETLTVTVPKLKLKASEPRRIEITSDSGAAASEKSMAKQQPAAAATADAKPSTSSTA